MRPWPGSSVGWSVIPICQGRGFDPQSRHILDSTNECTNKVKQWIDVSLSLPPSLKSINKIFFKKSTRNLLPNLCSLVVWGFHHVKIKRMKSGLAQQERINSVWQICYRLLSLSSSGHVLPTNVPQRVSLKYSTLILSQSSTIIFTVIIPKVLAVVLTFKQSIFTRSFQQSPNINHLKLLLCE